MRLESLTYAKFHSWSKEEDKLLLQAADKYPNNWKKVAEAVGTNKDEKDCYNRVHKLAAGTKIGKWSKE